MRDYADNLRPKMRAASTDLVNFNDQLKFDGGDADDRPVASDTRPQPDVKRRRKRLQANDLPAFLTMPPVVSEQAERHKLFDNLHLESFTPTPTACGLASAATPNYAPTVAVSSAALSPSH
jgi:hypothetical protein